MGTRMEIEGLRGRWLTKQTSSSAPRSRDALPAVEEAHPYLRPGRSDSRGGAAICLLLRELHRHDQKSQGSSPTLDEVGQ